MASITEYVKYIYEVDSGKMSKELDNIKGKTDSIGTSFTNAGKKTAKYSALAGGTLAVAAKGALEGEVAVKRFNQVFGESADILNDFYNANKNTIALTEEEYKSAAAGIGDLLVPLGATREEAANMSNQAIETAQALADWSGVDLDTAIQAQTKALLGEREGLKQLGISINSTAVSERSAIIAKEQGLDATNELTDAMATQALIAEKSGDALTAYGDSVESGGTQQKNLSVAMRDLRQALENLGNAIAPAIAPMVSAFAEFANLLANIPTPILAIGGAILGLIAILSPLLFAIGGIASGISGLISLFGLLSSAISFIGPAIAIITGPIGLVVIAIIGLIALIWKFRDEFILGLQIIGQYILSGIEGWISFFQGFWEFLKGLGANFVLGMQTIFEVAKNLVVGYFEFWFNIWSNIFSFVNGLWQDFILGVQTIFSWLVSGVQNVASIYISVWSSIFSAIASGVDWIVGKFQSFLSFVLGIPGAIKDAFLGIGSTIAGALSFLNPFSSNGLALSPAFAGGFDTGNGTVSNNNTSNNTTWNVQTAGMPTLRQVRALERGLNV